MSTTERITTTVCMPPSAASWSRDPFVALADFERQGDLGAGSCGTVFRAQHRTSGQLVAIKTSRMYLSELWNEAFMLEGLNHPNLPHLLTYWEDQGTGYLAMELVDGANLAEGLSQEPARLLAVEEVLECAAQVSAGLAYLHALDPAILHRDVKPNNMVRTPEGRVVLIDFDAAVFVGEEEYEDQGTWSYSAPEQDEGHPTPHSDIFALGVSLWEMLTGACPAPVQRIYPPLPDACPATLKTCLRRMIAQEEDLRPDAAECLAFFQVLSAAQGATSQT